jgi:hypothetical protein
MPNTTNYSFPTPADTDLVKNGADAIRDLGDAVDTAMNTALGTKKAGMVLLNTTSFSGAVSHSFGSDAAPIFTSAFTNYRITLDNVNVATANQDVSLRVRANTTDLTGAVYQRQYGIFTGSTVLSGRQTGQTTFTVGSVGNGANETSAFVIDIFNPQTTNYTSMMSTNMYLQTGLGPSTQIWSGYVSDQLQYNGFTIFATNNVSGNMSVYGYNK